MTNTSNGTRPSLTDEQRAALDAEIEEIANMEDKVYALRQPYDDLLRSLDTSRALILARYGLEGVEVLHCETCSKLLIDGDTVHRCSDGPVLCAECAPTYADLKKRADAISATDDDDGDADEIRAAVAQHVVTGGSLSDTALHPLNG
jgi:hypothetical protein